MTYEQLLNWFDRHTHIGDTYFSYPGNEGCVIGATNEIFYDSNLRPLSHGETFYWAGYGCDIRNGVDYPSAKELFEAPIYEGRSIKDRWTEISWASIDGWMSEEEFDRVFEGDPSTSS